MKDKVVFTFGRMNPPTIGHAKLVDIVKREAGKRGADPHIYLSHSQDAKKNPLDYNAKIRLAQSAFGPSVKKTGHKTVIDILKMLSKRGVKEVVMVVGSDRVPEFDRILDKYNGKEYKFDSIRVISAGERDPDADGVSGMSASKLRGLAKSGDFDGFKTGMPSSLSNAEVKKVYNKIRSTIKEEIELIDESLDKHISDFSKGVKSSKSKSSLSKTTGKPVANMKHVETDAKPDEVFAHLKKMGFKKRKGYDPNPNSFTTRHNADTMTTKSDSVHHDSGVSVHFEKEHGSKMKVHFYKEELGEEKDGLKGSCWKNYVAIGTKKKNGKTVPNCVPKK